ncbi:MAG: diguanylate cyclase [Deltaproteobacteria bacterium]|nr:diguanylate cyclase [Deltaproteobacteria bacterium]
MIYKVVKQTIPIGDNEWNKSPWDVVKPVQIKYHMGNKPDHFPKTEVKLTYDDLYIYVIFKVEDRYVRSVATEDQGNVWEDSCVEFFFTPSDDVSNGYFNIEMNCGGTMLFHFQKERNKHRTIIPKSELNKIARIHSLPKIVDPEIREPVTWTVEYSVPIELLKKYCELTTPAPGVKWRANFYKCGDKTSLPHWLTWSPVDCPKPNFHLPEYFGVIEFL